MRDEIHVWWLEVEQLAPTVRDALHAHLDDAERARWARFHFERDRTVYSVAHGLLRQCLSWFVGRTKPAVPPEAWRFHTQPGGKPSLQGDPGVYFSLTHTRGLAAVAVAPLAELGVDAETLGRLDSVLALAEHYFSPKELVALRRLSDPEAQQTLFLRLWSLKEAYSKARGVGLRLGLERFGFELSDSIRFFADAGLDPRPQRWRFHQWWATSRHVVAAAVGLREGQEARLIVHANELPEP